MPNDDAEQLREGLKHKLYVDYILPGNGLVIAPIGDYPQKLVDLGTGAGFWAQDGLPDFSTVYDDLHLIPIVSGREIP